MSPSQPPAEWRLPPGVSKGAWESFQQADWAAEEDPWLAGTPLVQLDQAFTEEQLPPPPGRIADLGCGAGRISLALARRGYQPLAIDLSQGMLEHVRAKAEAEGLAIECRQENLVELGGIEPESCDGAVCLFSTLGMIRGADNRRKAVEGFHRIIKPGGVLVLHAHQFWWSLRQHGGMRWLARHLLDVVQNRTELGDRYATYRGVPNFYLHSFRRRELRSLLQNAGFRITKMRALTGEGGDYLRAPWLVSPLRTGGWLIACEKPKRNLRKE
jgi:ubiquinone/menaquinone biosynthesis C-methylase UbiE